MELARPFVQHIWPIAQLVRSSVELDSFQVGSSSRSLPPLSLSCSISGDSNSELGCLQGTLISIKGSLPWNWSLCAAAPSRRSYLWRAKAAAVVAAFRSASNFTGGFVYEAQFSRLLSILAAIEICPKRTRSAEIALTC